MAYTTVYLGDQRCIVADTFAELPTTDDIVIGTPAKVGKNDYTLSQDGAWIQTASGGAANVITGTGGGASSVTTLENFLVAGGASQTGTAVSFPSGRATFQAVANGTSGAYTATVDIYGSNDGTNFELLGTVTLSGTATTADSDGFATDAPWAYVRADVSSFTGTGATCDVYMAV